MKLRESLDKGPRAYFSLDATKSAEDAIRLMAEKHVSAVIVTEGGGLWGFLRNGMCCDAMSSAVKDLTTR